MKPKTLALSGLILILAGTAGAGISRIRLAATYDALDGSPTSPASVAEAVGGAIGPAAIGSLLALAGVIMLLLSLWNWWKLRSRRRFTLSDG